MVKIIIYLRKYRQMNNVKMFYKAALICTYGALGALQYWLNLILDLAAVSFI
jgi:hypothetical protein